MSAQVLARVRSLDGELVVGPRRHARRDTRLMRARRFAFVWVLGLLGASFAMSPGAAQRPCEPQATSCAVTVIDPTALIGKPAPVTSGRNLTGSGTLTLSTLLADRTAIVFWLNTCPHCRAALPAIDRLWSHRQSGQAIVSAAIDAGLKGPKGFETPLAAAKTLHLEMPTILVANDVAQQQWMVAQTPTAYILDADGVIVDVLEGSEKAKLARAIKKALVG